MKLNELIERLEDLRDNEGQGESEVMIGADYGDISHTMQALYIRSAERRDLYETAYSHSKLGVLDPREFEPGEAEDAGMKTAGSAVILS
jgi:hypothetical protein